MITCISFDSYQYSYWYALYEAKWEWTVMEIKNVSASVDFFFCNGAAVLIQQLWVVLDTNPKIRIVSLGDIDETLGPAVHLPLYMYFLVDSQPHTAITVSDV